MSKKKLKLRSSQKRIVVPGLKLSRVCPIGTVQAKMDHTDDERTIGVFEFDPPNARFASGLMRPIRGFALRCSRSIRRR